MEFTQALNETLVNRLLDELYLLVQTEQERELTIDETSSYLTIVSLLEKDNIEIPFGYVV